MSRPDVLKGYGTLVDHHLVVAGGDGDEVVDDRLIQFIRKLIPPFSATSLPTN